MLTIECGISRLCVSVLNIRLYVERWKLTEAPDVVLVCLKILLCYSMDIDQYSGILSLLHQIWIVFRIDHELFLFRDNSKSRIVVFITSVEIPRILPIEIMLFVSDAKKLLLANSIAEHACYNIFLANNRFSAGWEFWNRTRQKKLLSISYDVGYTRQSWDISILVVKNILVILYGKMKFL